MLDHNISLWFVAHEIQRKQLILPLGLYRSTPNNFKKVIITIFQNYLGIRDELNAFARVSPLTPSELARFPCFTPMLTHKSEL